MFLENVTSHGLRTATVLQLRMNYEEGSRFTVAKKEAPRIWRLFHAYARAQEYNN